MERLSLPVSRSAPFVILNEASNGERSEESDSRAWRANPGPVLLSAKRSICDMTMRKRAEERIR